MSQLFTRICRRNLFLICAAVHSMVGMVSGATFNVTQTTDGDNVTQLRGAIKAAEALGGGPHTINVPAGTYNLTSGTIAFGDKALEINIVGAGAGSTVINMVGNNRIFLINPDGQVHQVSAFISGIKFTNGKASDVNGGAAVLCGGPENTILFLDCHFENNSVTQYGGGAVAMAGGGKLSLDRCNFINNKVLSGYDSGTGGAVDISYASYKEATTGTASITECRFEGNSATSTFGTLGGAISVRASYSEKSTSFYTRIERNVFINNSATSNALIAEGGAIAISSSFAADINYNAFIGNTIDNGVKEGLATRRFGAGVITANDNWWGCNTDPRAAGTCGDKARIVGSAGDGQLVMASWLTLKTFISNIQLCWNSVTALTVAGSFQFNSAGNQVPEQNLSAVVGLPVTFNAANGTISDAESVVQANGRARASFNSSGPGNGSVGATSGYLSASDVSVPVLTSVPPTVQTHPLAITTCAGAASASFSGSGNSYTDMTYQWYKGDSELADGSKYQGVNTATLIVKNITEDDHGGEYRLMIRNSCGSVTTNTATLQIQSRLYVALGASGQGSSWDDALGDLSTALSKASSCTGIREIWVKSGTYFASGYPYSAALPEDSHKAFYLINKVALYGGFSGNETELSQRNPGANQTILSADTGIPGDRGDNAYHAVVSVSNDNTAHLDGFIIRDGNAVRSDISAEIAGVTVPAHQGGGLFIHSSSPVIANCVFTANVARRGGGIYIEGQTSKPLISNSLIVANSSTGDFGGGVFNGANTGATLQNCTIARNIASDGGGGVANDAAALPTIANSVIWDNFGMSGPSIYDPTSTSILSNTILQQTWSGGSNILTKDPMFVNQTDPDGDDNQWMTADDGLRLQPCSPAIDGGTNAFAGPGSTDIAGSARIFNLTVDIGAYEMQLYRDGISLSESGDVVTQDIVDGAVNGFLASNCRIMARIQPTGASPVSGCVEAKVWVEGGVVTKGASRFVQRHYELMPAAHAATATARITLFFSQPEFDAFNNGAGTRGLPSSPTDWAGKSNLLIVQYHGTSPTGEPGSYSGGTKVIDPDDNAIVWNDALNRWEVSFMVTGFSGFFVSNADPLPLKLISFSANAAEDVVNLEWTTAEEVNTSHFEIHRSADARNWQVLPGQPPAVGSGGHLYDATDADPLSGVNYYRLKMIDLDGSYAYSHIAAASHRSDLRLQIFPNPATRVIRAVLTRGGDGKAELFHLGGTLVVSQDLIDGKVVMQVGSLPKGLYLIRIREQENVWTRRVVIE